MSRQYNGPHDLDMMNSELETRMQEQELNQSGRPMQSFVKNLCLYTDVILLVVVMQNSNSHLKE